ncbi:MAG: hypothetical protein RIM84_05375 [Alphaproteobacteria bacterium]
MPYVVGLSMAGAAVPLCVALVSRDKALRDIGMTVLKFVVLLPVVATGVAVGLIHAIV